MVRSELLQKIRDEHPNLTKPEAEAALDAIFESIITTLEDKGRVELRGYFSFHTRDRGARIGRNPRNGEKVQVPPKTAVGFKCGREMFARLNPEKS